MADELIRSVADGVAVLTLNRPDRLNAVNLPLGRAYDRAMVEMARDPAVRVIVVTGAGRGFCGGADAGRLSGLADDGGASLADPEGNALEGFTEAPEHLRRRYTVAMAVPKPVIAAVNGACAGVGLALAVSCDVRFASESAFFTGIFARRGLVAESGLAWSLPRVVGRSFAADMLLSGRRIDAQAALRHGLVTQVLAPDHLLEQTLAYARDIAANISPRSARVIKEQLRAAEASTFAEALGVSDRMLKGSLASADFREGIDAMREGRPPRFPNLPDRDA